MSRDVAIGGVTPRKEDQIYFSVESYTEPKAWYTFDARQGQTSTDKQRISTEYGVDFDDVEISRVTVESPDGAQVPLTVVHRSDLEKEGASPTILMGYGSFGRSLTPRFDPMARIWLDHGGVLAFAHVRGGGEFGDGWHTAGATVHKGNAIVDFHACADHLIKEQYTKSSKLAVWETATAVSWPGPSSPSTPQSQEQWSPKAASSTCSARS